MINTAYNDFQQENKISYIQSQVDNVSKFLYDRDITSESYVNLINTIIKLAPDFAPNERFIFQWIDDKESKK
jgi:hypothetical protein